jgi:hypothetical protein
VPLTFFVTLPLIATVPVAVVLYLAVLLSFRQIRQNEAWLVIQAFRPLR